MPPKREYTEQERADLRTMKVLEELVGSNGWKTFVGLLNSKKVEWHTKILQPMTNQNDLFVGEFAKGAVYGLTQATDLPGIIIQGVKDSILPAKDEEV